MGKRGRKPLKVPRPLQEVFYKINMHGGDTNVCWEWKGAMSPNPIWVWHRRRVQATRVVYALKKNIPLDKVPQLTWTCGNNRCCNPHHLVERFGIEEKIIGYASSRARGQIIKEMKHETSKTSGSEE